MFQVQVHSHILEMWAFTVSSVGEGVEHFDVQERAGNGILYLSSNTSSAEGRLESISGKTEARKLEQRL